jgi:hypothetical protein
MTAESLDLYRSAGLAEVDPEIASLLGELQLAGRAGGARLDRRQ